MQIKESETRLIMYIRQWETTNSEILGRGQQGTDNEMTIYKQKIIYLNSNRSDILLWHVVCHIPQNKKLQSVADR